MAVGQQVFAGTLDVGAVLAVEARMAMREVERSAVHAGLLRDVLELRRSYGRDGLGVAVAAQVALVLRCSDYRAGELLTAAVVLTDLPGALKALECGLLGVELWHTDPSDHPRWDDPAGLELRTDDLDDTHTPDHDDPLGDSILTSNTRWTLDLDDPYAWIDSEAHLVT